MTRRRYVLVDRDGTINEEVRGEYVLAAERMILIPGVAEGLRDLQQAGLRFAVVTNQSPVGRGWIDEPQLEAIHRRMLDLLAEAGVEIDGIYVCPHRPDEGCSCRKPQPELALRAAAELDFSPREAFVVGDKDSDIEMGRRVGATTVLVLTGQGSEALENGVRPDHVAADMREAATIIRGLIEQEA